MREAYEFLRKNREEQFDELAEGILRELGHGRGNPKKTLREVLELLVAGGIYAESIPWCTLSRMLLGRLYFFHRRTGGRRTWENFVEFYAEHESRQWWVVDFDYPPPMHMPSPSPSMRPNKWDKLEAGDYDE